MVATDLVTIQAPTKVITDDAVLVIVVQTPTVSFEDPFASVQEYPEFAAKNISFINVMKTDGSELAGCWKRLSGR